MILQEGLVIRDRLLGNSDNTTTKVDASHHHVIITTSTEAEGSDNRPKPLNYPPLSLYIYPNGFCSEHTTTTIIHSQSTINH